MRLGGSVLLKKNQNVNIRSNDTRGVIIYKLILKKEKVKKERKNLEVSKKVLNLHQNSRMTAKIDANNITIDLGRQIVTRKVKWDHEIELAVFKEGTLKKVYNENYGWFWRGGFFVGQMHYFLKGKSLKELSVSHHLVSSTNIGPYQGVRSGDSWNVRLYEPKLFEIPHQAVVDQEIKIKGVWYKIEKTQKNAVKLKTSLQILHESL